MSQSNPVAKYQPTPPRLSRWALALFIASIISAVGFFFVLPSLAVMIVAMIVKNHLAKQTKIAGYGFALAAVTVSGCAALLGVVTLVLTPSLGHRDLRGRSYCAANLRGIAQSMSVYAADNSDWYPIVPFAPYASVPNSPVGSPISPDPDVTLRTLVAEHSPQAGTVQGCMWILVLSGQVAPKQFTCRQDTYYDTPALITDAGKYYDNFQQPHQLSYSMAYPWNADGKPAPFWKSTADASLPLFADMTPKQGTGKPAHNLTPASEPKDPKTWNSGNHAGDGQNIAFGDGHAEFARRPDTGQNNDNIYTMSANPSTGPAQFGGIPAGFAAPNLTADKPPYDILMLPVRDESTGKM